MRHSNAGRNQRIAAAVLSGAVVLGLGVVAPGAANAAPAPAPAAPVILFEETFENAVGAAVTGLAGYVGDQGATYDASPFWLNAAYCNGLILQQGGTWNGAAAQCPAGGARDRLMELAYVLGGSDNHVVAAYTGGDGGAGETLLSKSSGSGITVTQGKFYVASIDIAEVNCLVGANQSSIAFGLVLPSGEVMIGGSPTVACNTGQSTTVNGREIKHGTFYSAGFLAGETGDAEYLVRNNTLSGAGNDFAYDNLRFYDATPTLHKSFSEDAVEVGQPVTMQLTVVNTTERSQKTGWSFTDNMPAGMAIAAQPNVSTTCAAADITAAGGTDVLEVENGSLAAGSESCTISVDVILEAGGDFTNTIVGADGLNGEPSAAVRALVPSMSLTKTVAPSELTADNREATYTFTVLNDGDVDLHDVAVSDPGPVGGKGTLGPIDCGGITELAVGDELVCTAVYTADLADLNGAALTNEAKASGVTPAGTRIEADGSAGLPTVTPKPELTLVKSADVDVATKAGQVITYSFVVTNTGNVKVADVEVAEGTFSGAGKLSEVVCPAEAELLAPAASVTCTALYTVFAADLTGKAFTNTAAATGIGPNGPVVSADSTVQVKTLAPVLPGSLANTGAGLILPLAASMLLLLLAGAGAVMIARRKQMN